MPVSVKNIRSLVQNQAPTAGTLQPGQIAVNYHSSSPALYIENNLGSVVQVAGSGSSKTGVIGYWDRTGTTVSPVNAGDSITTTGTLNGANLVLTNKATSVSTTSGDAATTLVTKDFVDNSISGAFDGTGTGNIGYWNRTGTNVSPLNANDKLLFGSTVAYTGAESINARLQLHGNGGSSSSWQTTRWSANTGSPICNIQKSRSANLGVRGLVQSGDDLGVLQFAGDDGTNFIPAASIVGQVDGTSNTNDIPGRLVFKTTPSNSSASIERVRITSQGYVGIGTSTPGAFLEIGELGGGVILASPNGTRYEITVDNNGNLTTAAV